MTINATMVMLKINNQKAAPKIASSIDIHCEIQAVPFAQLSQILPGEPSAVIRDRVIKARNIQTERFSKLPSPSRGVGGRPHCNAQMTERMLHQFAQPDAASLDITIADLAGSEKVQSVHIAEAIGYRNLDRGDWAERGI